MKDAVIRFARPTDQLQACVEFYRDGLGFEILAQFVGHDGFDGSILGHPGAAYHLEFTTVAGHTAGRCPTQDHLMAFYIPDETEWQQAVEGLKAVAGESVPSFNPYWDRQGLTFEDPDGYRIVLWHGAWG